MTSQNNTAHILVRLRGTEEVVGATRHTTQGKSNKFWPDYYALFTKRAKYSTVSVFVPEDIARALVAQGKLSQVYVNGFEAFEDMMDKASFHPDQVISPATDTFWACHLTGKSFLGSRSHALVEYYESLYCKEGSKYYGKPESFEGYKGSTGSDTVCMVPEGNG